MPTQPEDGLKAAAEARAEALEARAEALEARAEALEGGALCTETPLSIESAQQVAPGAEEPKKISNRKPSSTCGIVSMVAALIALVIAPLLLVPVSIIAGTLSVCQEEQYGWGVVGVVIALFAAVNSPTIQLLILGAQLLS